MWQSRFDSKADDALREIEINNLKAFHEKEIQSITNSVSKIRLSKIY